MPRHIWGTSPDEHSLFAIRRSRYRRWGVVCFHCRTMVTLYQDNDGEEVFNTHYDVERGRGHGPSYVAHRSRGGTRQVGPYQQDEICPGSEHRPIPLAYKWMDGTPIPDSIIGAHWG
jgi:hypothetical protein